MRRASRKDQNHGQTVNLLRAYGCEVHDTGDVGKGFPDLVVFVPRFDRVFLVEVKDGRRPPSERKLTPDQEKFHIRFPVRVIKSEDDIHEWLGRP